MGLIAEDMPRGAVPLASGLGFLLLAGLSLLAGTNAPAPYRPLAHVTGTVADLWADRGGRVHVALDTAPGLPAYDRVDVRDPGLTGAADRLRALPLGERVDIDYDAWTGKVWRLARADGAPGYDTTQLGPWQAADHAAGRRRAIWLAIAGIAMLVAGVVRMIRDPDD